MTRPTFRYPRYGYSAIFWLRIAAPYLLGIAIGSLIGALLGLHVAGLYEATYDAQQRSISDLTARNIALNRLCGPSATSVPCLDGESGADCQSRMGDEWEVIQLTNREIVAERKP